MQLRIKKDYRDFQTVISLILTTNRLSLGLTEAQVSDALSISEESLGLMEDGCSPIPLVLFFEWCDVLELDTIPLLHKLIGNLPSMTRKKELPYENP